MESGDGIVIMLIVAGLACWMYVRARRWVRNEAIAADVPDIPVDDDIPEDEAVVLLQDEGYEVLSGKKRLPITIELNESEQLESRLFIDYFARRDDDIYIVKLARDRKPLELTGSGIRDQFLCYQLAFPQASAILYVDMSSKKIVHIRIQTDTGGIS